MAKFIMSRKRPKPLGRRMIWRLAVICAVLFTALSNGEQSPTSKPQQDSSLKAIDLNTSSLQLSPTSSLTNGDNKNLSTDIHSGNHGNQSATSTTKSVLPPVAELMKNSQSSEKQLTPRNVSDPTSCQDRCADDLSFPCSCSATCIINGNCCSDMQYKCIHVLYNARARFKHQRSVKVECSSLTSTFMIMSCPDDSRSKENEDGDVGEGLFPAHDGVNSGTPGFQGQGQEIPPWTTAPSLSPHNLGGKQLNGTVELDYSPTDAAFSVSEVNEKIDRSGIAFLTLLLDSPVTDSSTGIVYRNHQVARCNRVSTDHMLHWNIIIEAVSEGIQPEHPQHINQMLATDNFVYIHPNLGGTIPVKNQCFSFAKQQCQDEWLEDRPELEELCLNGSIVYYKTVSPLTQTYFKNKDCLLCNLGFDNYSIPATIPFHNVKTFRFSVVASLSSGRAVSVRSQYSSLLFTWNDVECSLTEGPGGGRCDISECKPPFQKRADGKCRGIQSLVISIGGGSCPYKRSQETERKFLSLSKCYLETYRDVEFKMDTVGFQTVYDTRLGRSLIELSVRGYFPSVRHLFQRSSAQIWREILVLVYSAGFCCESQPPVSSCTELSCRLGDLEIPRVVSNDFFYKVRHFEIGNMSGAVSNSSTVICLGRPQPRQDSLCIEEPVLVSLLPFLERAASVPCFQDAIGKHAQHAHTRNPHGCTGSKGRCVTNGLGLVFTLLVIGHYSWARLSSESLLAL